jgi:hypothetical protein
MNSMKSIQISAHYQNVNKSHIVCHKNTLERMVLMRFQIRRIYLWFSGGGTHRSY